MSARGDICFFSSTGNSFAIARELSEALSCRLVPICYNTKPDLVAPDGEQLGFVFPVYHASYGGSGIPHIVRRFIERIGDLRNRDIFVVCTHSGAPGNTMEHTRELIESNHGELRIGIPVQMSIPRSPWQKLSYMITKQPMGPIHKEQEKRLALYEDWGRRKTALLKDLDRNAVRVETLGGLKRLLWKGLSSSQQQLVRKRYQQLAQSTSSDLDELYRSSDKSFTVNERCNKCGTCVLVCPVRNIDLVDGPVWNHRCELCYACYQWCPQGAITGEIVEFEQRAHHPDVTLRDMIDRNTAMSRMGPA